MTTDKSSNDEVMRKCLKPDPSQSEVIAAICQNYHQPESSVKILKELESYDDRNYLIEMKDKKYLCKVYNGVESQKYISCKDLAAKSSDPAALSSIHLYSEIFSHLNQEKYGIKTSSPVPIPSSIAAPHIGIHTLPVTSKEHSPSKLAVQLLEWVEGVTLASIPHLPIETLIEAGQYLGKVCLALDDLTVSSPVAKMTADRYHAWDGKNTLDLQAFVSCIGDENRRALVQSVLDSFRKDIIEAGEDSKFRRGILQADFNDANIILKDGKVSGVIDFGDTTLSWRVLDVSVAMAYAMLSSYGKKDRGISAAAAILRGFNSIYPLQPEERKHLRLLMASRLSCSVTLGAYSYQQNPQNEYLLLHAQPAWDMLDLMWGSGQTDKSMPAAIDAIFDVACDACVENPFSQCADISFPDPSIDDSMSSARQLIMDGGNPPQKRQKISILNDEKPVITFVTGNKKKLEEVKRILCPSNDGSRQLPFIISNKKIDLPELQGDPIEIAKEKCALAAKEIGGPVVTEDTSLCFTALRYMPGPYIKWFLDKCGHKGLNDMIAFSDDKSGYAQTVVGFCPGPGKEVVTFDGRTEGTIVSPRGSLDFGWDPIFQPDESGGLTYAEMEKSAKDSISHRGRAFEKFRSYLLKEANSII